MSIHHQLKDHEGTCKVLSWSISLHKFACGLVLYVFVITAPAFLQEVVQGQSRTQLSEAAGSTDAESLDNLQWARLVRRTFDALGGSATGQSADTVVIQAAVDEILRHPAKQRREAFAALIDRWLKEDWSVRWRSESWMKDMISSDAIGRCNDAGWDIGIYRDWLETAIREGDHFDVFLRRHFLGDERLRSDRVFIPTAIWYLSKHHSAYGVVEAPTVIEANLMRPFRESLASIEHEEKKERERIAQKTIVERWYRGLATFPKPSKEELAGQWSVADGSLFEIEDSVYRIIKSDMPFKAFREWTFLLDVNLEASVLEAAEPILLFEQTVAPPAAVDVPETTDGLARFSRRVPVMSPPMRSIRLEIVRGCLQLRLIHDPLSSSLVLLSKTALSPGSAQIAVVNEGFGERGYVHLLLDGEAVPIEQTNLEYCSDGSEDTKQYKDHYNALYKEIHRGDRAIWRVIDDTKVGVAIDQFTAYRIALTGPECKGLMDNQVKPDWEELDSKQQAIWGDHYARRNDAQWRYQRESRLYYSGSLRSIRESTAMLPVLISPKSLVCPCEPSGFPTICFDVTDRAGIRFPSAPISSKAWCEAVGLSPSREDKSRLRAAKIAEQEVKRTWNALHRSAGLTIPEPIEGELVTWREEIAERFFGEWECDRMIRNLLLSDHWFSTASADH